MGKDIIIIFEHLLNHLCIKYVYVYSMCIQSDLYPYRITLLKIEEK